MSTKRSVVKITGAMQAYKWGMDAAPGVLVKEYYEAQKGEKTEEDKYAEVWLGTHPNGPATLQQHGSQTLKEYISEDPSFHLGPSTSTSDLPFLLKVLSISNVLSIQSHPDAALAAKLHAQDPAVYKTPCHKPEMAVALTDFKAMLGFLPVSTLAANMSSYPELGQLVGPASVSALLSASTSTAGMDFSSSVQSAVRAAFSSFMSSYPACGSSACEEMVARISSKPLPLSPTDSLILNFNSQYPNDCGVFSPLFLNVVELKPGQSIFVPSNTPHAYVSGQIVECMARR